jgi:hypothetical protein
MCSSEERPFWHDLATSCSAFWELYIDGVGPIGGFAGVYRRFQLPIVYLLPVDVFEPGVLPDRFSILFNTQPFVWVFLQ